MHHCHELLFIQNNKCLLTVTSIDCFRYLFSPWLHQPNLKKQCWNMTKFKIIGASKNSALFHEGFARLFLKKCWLLHNSITPYKIRFEGYHFEKYLKFLFLHIIDWFGAQSIIIQHQNIYIIQISWPPLINPPPLLKFLSLVLVQNLGFWPKQNTRFTVDTTTLLPTLNFFEGSKERIMLIYEMEASLDSGIRKNGFSSTFIQNQNLSQAEHFRP